MAAPTYLRLAELKAAIDEVDRRWDDQLARAIGAASRWIGRTCNDQFAPDAVARAKTFTAANPRQLTVGSLATTSGLTVEVDYWDTGTFAAPLAATQWTAETEMHRGQPGAPLDTLRAVEPTRWPDGRDNPSARRGRVRVTARWGWPETPDDVVDACQILAAGLFRAKDTSGGFAAAVRGLTAQGAPTPEYVLQAISLLDPLRRPAP